MEIGIDSFASAKLGENQLMPSHPSLSIAELMDRIVHADKSGLK